jgi:hypothetical protein
MVPLELNQKEENKYIQRYEPEDVVDKIVFEFWRKQNLLKNIRQNQVPQIKRSDVEEEWNEHILSIFRPQIKSTDDPKTDEKHDQA